jgi:hypothetical protein
MRGFKLLEKLPCRAGAAIRYVIKPLADAFLSIGARGDVEQALIGFRILHDGGGLSVNREHYGAFGFLKLFHEVAGRPPKCRQRLNVTCDVKHMHPRSLAPYKVLPEYTPQEKSRLIGLWPTK